MDNYKIFAAFLRGINVGGRHKVPMAVLQKELTNFGLKNVKTLLNSGNVIFQASIKSEEEIEILLTPYLEKVFGFPIPVLVRNSEEILELIQNNPFKNLIETKDTRFYISFLKNEPTNKISLPWQTEDDVFKILELRDRTICSFLDVSKIQTTKGMEMLETLYGKNITTRNWNTIVKIGELLKLNLP